MRNLTHKKHIFWTLWRLVWLCWAVFWVGFFVAKHEYIGAALNSITIPGWIYLIISDNTLYIKGRVDAFNETLDYINNMSTVKSHVSKPQKGKK